MSFLQNLPIGRKLTAIAMLTSLTALVLACAVFVIYEQIAFRATMARDLAITARMVGFSSTSALSFDDPVAAQRVLRGLSAQPQVVAACLYTTEGRLFAAYRRDKSRPVVWPAPQPDGAHFSSGALRLFQTIEADTGDVGSIYLECDLSELYARLWRYVPLLVLVVLGAGLVAYGIASRLKHAIADPVVQLAQLAGAVATEGNYAVRAVKRGDDELGRLVEAFNHMLAQIQARDDELQAARENLERRVEKRTVALQREIAERTRAVMALRESQQMSLSLLEHLPILVYRKDAEGRYVYANSHFCRFKGRTLEQLLGRTVFDVAGAPDFAARFHEQDRTVLATGRVVDTEGMHLAADGTIVHLHTIKVPVLDAGGRIVGTQGMFFDVTARRAAEAEREQMHRQLVEASRLAGMAEVATGVLHNVGNVLNSVNVSAAMVAEHVRKSRAASIASAAALLREHSGDLPGFFARDPRGREMVGFLETLAIHLAKERATIVAELELLRRNIEHIKGIVAMQQGYARVSGVAEPVELVELVEDALRLHAGPLERSGVCVIRDYRLRPILAIDKHRVLQILVNLIGNARNACDESGRDEPRIVVRIAPAGARVAVIVTDNGVGIPPENLTRIFSHGFTTRKDGHGFGLHSGALAAHEFGGTLAVQSEGSGRGATFTLELPLPPTLPSAAPAETSDGREARSA